ncbi:MAG: 4'-phosphopantetheinyl transferase superfamily protein [Nitrospiraceae bacterium]|nr:4'-phosphopantetheinyl transferase superfamily protein [Nitrospiraceae bacterium]
MNLHSLGPLVTFPSLEGLTTLDSLAPLALDDRAVHVWGFSLNGSAGTLSCCRAWLNEEERARAARFIRQEDRTRYLLAHGGLRALLARYTGFDPAALKFQTGSAGKPALLDQQGRPHTLRFNLSHSHGRMLIAVAQEQEVGVDLEEMRDRVDAVKLAKRFYASSEYRELLAHSGFDQVQQFYRYWVAKEAVLKGQGVGILSLRRCEILNPDNAGSSLVGLSDSRALQPGWRIRWLVCGSGWQGAVALQGMDWSVRVETAEEV